MWMKQVLGKSDPVWKEVLVKSDPVWKEVLGKSDPAKNGPIRHQLFSL